MGLMSYVKNIFLRLQTNERKNTITTYLEDFIFSIIMAILQHLSDSVMVMNNLRINFIRGPGFSFG